MLRPVLFLALVTSASTFADDPPAAPPSEKPAEAAPAETPAATPAPEATPAAAEPAVPATAESELFNLEEQMKVVSASQQEEPVTETPVPVTIITAEMIRNSGVRTLEEALLLFVPGFTPIQDHNERTLAMHGIYGSAQQQILVMEDGHELNSRAYQTADPDFSISLDKIKQIEVLRGPGSALYGNVSLTAVVNLVTKSGRDVSGVTVKGGLGNYLQRNVSVLVGNDFGDKGDVIFWGNYYYAGGQPVAIGPMASAAATNQFDKTLDQCFCAVPKNGQALVGSVSGPGDYDVGFKYKISNFEFFGERRGGKSMTEPFTSGGSTGEVYDIGAFRTFQGMTPGLSQTFNHLSAKYAPSFGDHFDLEVRAYYDSSEMQSLLASSGDTNGGVFLSWVDMDVGATAFGRLKYDFGKLGQGNLIIGGQYEYMAVLDSNEPVEAGGDFTKFGDTAMKRLLDPGHEMTTAGFVQLKHKMFDMLILNVGARYDYRFRHQPAAGVVDNVGELSPRLALIFAPKPIFDLKLSYSSSFVDAPYWYRYNALASYQGSSNLKPQHLKSVQLTATGHFMQNKVSDSLNVFYNDNTDTVFRDNAGCAMAMNPVCYRNAGTLDIIGVEDELAIAAMSWWRLRANITFMTAVKQDTVYVPTITGNEIPNIPMVVANAVLEVNPLIKWTEKFWITGVLHVNGQQLAPITSSFKDAMGNVLNNYTDLGWRLPTYSRFDFGLHVSDLPVKGLMLDATLSNAFNTTYFQGGSPTHPYPQPGLWGMVNLGYHLPL